MHFKADKKEILLRRCPEDINIKIFLNGLKQMVNKSKYYSGYKVVHIQKISEFIDIWNSQTAYSDNMKNICISSLENNRLFALV